MEIFLLQSTYGRYVILYETQQISNVTMSVPFDFGFAVDVMTVIVTHKVSCGC